MVVINCRHVGLLFLVSVVLGVARGGLLGQVWVQRGPRLREGAGLPARAGAGGFPHREGLHWGLCVPSALPCAVGVQGVPWLWGGMCPAPLAGVAHLARETWEAEMLCLWATLVCLTANQHFSLPGSKLVAVRRGWWHFPPGM